MRYRIILDLFMFKFSPSRNNILKISYEVSGLEANVDFSRDKSTFGEIDLLRA